MARRGIQRSLNVWLNGTPVGQWTIRRNTSTFAYFQEWLEDEWGNLTFSDTSI
jgi:serine/threonine-protein kinase HipA